jgi:hypothetical protein
MPAFPFALPPRNKNDLSYIGPPMSTMPAVEFPRAPLPSDVNYPLFTIWRNSNANAVAPDALGDFWYLAYAFFNLGAQQAKWLKLASGSGPSLLNFSVPLGTSPVFANSFGNINLTSTGSSVAITGGTNSINFDVVGTGDLIWQTIFASQSLAAKNGYICVSPGGALLLALPAVSSLGDTIEVTLDGATSFTITQPNSTSQVRYGNITTTLGTGGSLTTTNPGDTIRIVCQTANSRWNILSSIGNITYV